MGIYTKTGDKGTTGLLGGVRIVKTDIQVEAYGTIDELNTHISLAQKQVSVISTVDLLETVQHQLFFIGAELASPNVTVQSGKQQQVSETDIELLEQAIDEAMARVPKLQSFVLPGRSVSSSQLHVARAVSRRAERRVLALDEVKPVRAELIHYLNRLSDLLYALARLEDQEQWMQTTISKVVERYSAQSNPRSDTGPTFDQLTQITLNMLHGAMREAKQIGVAIVFALVDKHGNTILQYRMPSALLVSIELALKKGYTAVALNMPTHELQQHVQPGQPLYQLETSCDNKLVSFGGGFPIRVNGQLIGGIGISGGSCEQDMQIAQAALAEFQGE